MILPALIEHYDRLAEAGEDVAPYGFSRQKISFCVHLDEKGKPYDTERPVKDLRVESGRGSKLIARRMVVPGQSKPSGQGINPCLLWDNSSYMLGRRADDPNPDRTRQSFEAFREKHLGLRGTIDDKAFEAVCAFLATWDPGAYEPGEEEAEALSSFGVFRVGKEKRFVHERPAVRDWYVAEMKKEAEAERPSAPSLTTGEPSPIARLHEPKIKGVWGAQSSGAAMVSFNESAFESYGKSQGENAPVAEQDAFRYCTALNHLLADDTRRTTIGDATVVWWADAPAAEGEATIASFFTGRAPDDDAEEDDPESEHAKTKNRVRAAVKAIAAGEPPQGLSDADARFHVLGLSPNAARLSVRFWWDGRLGEMVDKIVQHQRDARIEPVPVYEAGRPLSIYRMVRATARVHGDRSDMDTVSPTLSGEIARAVLTGGPYPISMLESIVRRVRADGRLDHTRAAIVKACITRRRRVLAGRGRTHEEVPVSLNPDGPEAYQLGRLFAVLEKTQGDALGEVDATIRDRYFGSASATPAAVFPRLIRLNQHHIAKLEGGWRVNREKLLQEVCSHIDRFPRHLSLEEQGLFQIGFYHQRQAFYTKNENAAEAAAEPVEN